MFSYPTEIKNHLLIEFLPNHDRPWIQLRFSSWSKRKPHTSTVCIFPATLAKPRPRYRFSSLLQPLPLSRKHPSLKIIPHANRMIHRSRRFEALFKLSVWGAMYFTYFWYSLHYLCSYLPYEYMLNIWMDNPQWRQRKERNLQCIPRLDMCKLPEKICISWECTQY